MTTEATADQLDRITRLRSQRGHRPAGRAPAGETTGDRPPRRRRAGAATKVLIVGASTTSALAMVAAYGAADRTTAEPGAPPVDGPAAELSSSPAAAAPTPIAPAATPVVVVVVDSRTGRSIGGSRPRGVDVGALVDRAGEETPARRTRAAGRHTRGRGAAAPTRTPPAADLVPVQPTTVDLAVPAPTPSPAPAASPAPAPAAETGGS